MILFIYIVALLVGLLSGLTGVGGVLLIPALTEFAAMDAYMATGTALSSFILPSLLASWLFLRRGALDWETALPLALGGFLFGYLGAWLKAFVSGNFIIVLLAALVVLAGCNALKTPKPGKLNIATAPRAIRRLFLFCLGAFVGIIGGLAGCGGAILSVPVMLFCGFSPLPSIGASVFFAVPSGISSSIGNMQLGYIAYSMLPALILLQIGGMYTGIRLASRAPADLLRKVVALVCMGTGLFLAANPLVLLFTAQA